MFILQEPQLSEYSTCSYLPDREWRYEYFFATELNGNELNRLLENGWRKFGMYFFRPDCITCRECIPLRIDIKDFKPSKNQRRVLRNGDNISVKFGSLNYSDEIYEVYRDHSENRFNRVTDRENFISTFYAETCPSVQSEYYIDGNLFGVGFLDVSDDALSSAYFVFKSSFEKISPGTLSVLKEIEYGLNLGLKYYYLGYYISENQSMSYKNRFHPNEKYDWERSKWNRES